MKTKAMLILSSFTLTACDPFKGLRGYGQEAGANGKSKRFKNARGGRGLIVKKDLYMLMKEIAI